MGAGVLTRAIALLDPLMRSGATFLALEAPISDGSVLPSRRRLPGCSARRCMKRHVLCGSNHTITEGQRLAHSERSQGLLQVGLTRALPDRRT